jgi:hypothetical protein
LIGPRPWNGSKWHGNHGKLPESTASAFLPLRKATAMPMYSAIELRPDDLALPRTARLTNEIPPKISTKTAAHGARLKTCT